MTRCITRRNGMKVERLGRLPSPPRIHQRAGCPSQRIHNWKALPVEGSAAWRSSRPGILTRLINR